MNKSKRLSVLLLTAIAAVSFGTATFTACELFLPFESDINSSSSSSSSSSSDSSSSSVEHSHTLEKQNGQAATCAADGWKDYYKCSDCEELYEDAQGTKAIADLDAWKVGDGKLLATGQHTQGELKSDGTTEWYECTACGAKFDEVAHNHVGGTASCVDKADCTVCGQEYGEFGAHVLALVNGQAKTCEEDGWKDYYKCSVCDALYEDADATKAIADLDAWKIGEGKLAAGHVYENGTCSGCGISQSAYESLNETGAATLLTGNGDYTANADKRLGEIEGVAMGGVLNWNGIPWNDGYYTPDNEAEILAGSKDGKVLKTGLVVWGYTKLPYVSFNNVVKASDVEQISFRIYAHLSDTPSYGGYDGTKFADPSTKGIFIYGNNAQAGKAEGGVMIDPYVQQDAWIDYVIKGADIAKLADENGNISGFYFGSLICGGIYNTTDGGNPATAQALVYIDGVTVSTHAMEEVGGKAATCVENGWKGYYHCSDCDKNYADEAGKVEITNLDAWKAGDGKIPATNVHTLEKVDGQAAACTIDGWKDYYKCSICGALYEDAEGTKTIADLDAWKVGDGKIASVGAHGKGDLMSDGVTEWYECTECGVKFDEVAHNHVGGTATCVDKAECSVCGQEYGAFSAHVLALVNGQAKTCYEDGWKDYYECSVCGELYEDEEGATAITDLGAWKVGDGKIACTGHSFVEGTCSECGVTETATKELAEKGITTLLTVNGDYTANSDKRLSEINGSAIGGVLNWNGLSWNTDAYTPDNEAEILAGSRDGNVLKTGLVVWGYTKLPYVSFNNVVKASDVEQISFRIYAHLSDTPGYGGYNGTNFADPSTKGIFLYGNNAQAGKADGGIMIDPYVQQDAWINYVITGKDVAKLADENGNISGFYFGSLICGGIYNTTDGSNPATAQALIYIDGVTVSKGNVVEKIGGKAATCTEEGWSDYYYNPVTDKYYSDEACTNEITDLAAWKVGEGKLDVAGHNYVDGTCSGCGITETATKELEENGRTELLTANGDYSDAGNRLSKIEGAGSASGMTWGGAGSFATIQWNNTLVLDNEADILAGSKDGKVLKTGIFSYGQTQLPYIAFTNVVKASEVDKITFRIYAHLSSGSTYGNGGLIYFYGNNANAGKAGGGVILNSDITQNAWVDFVITGADIAKLADENGNISGFYLGSHILVDNPNYLYISTVGTDSTSAPAILFIDSVTVSKNVVQKVSGKAATCTEEGWKDYYYNPGTDKNYSDAECTNEITDLEAWKVGDGKLAVAGHTYVDGTCSGCGVTETATKALEENGTATLLTANGDYTNEEAKCLSKVEGQGSGGLTWATSGGGINAEVKWNNTYTLANEGDILAGSSDGNVLKTGILVYGQTRLSYIRFNQVVKASEVDKITFRIYAHLSSGSTYGNGGLIYFYGDNANAGKAGGGVALKNDVTQDAWIDYEITGADIMKLADANGNISGFYLCSYIMVASEAHLYNSTSGTDATSAHALLFIDSVSVSKSAE